MTLRLLIDERLSTELMDMARQAGFVDITCVRDRGWVGKKDWNLMERIVAEDFTLVTHNAHVFRGEGQFLRFESRLKKI